MDVLISLNNGKTFISSAYTITASTCSAAPATRSRISGRRRSDGSVVVIVILVLLALLALALMWWLWPLCCTVVSLADLLVTNTPIFACLAAAVFVLVERAAVAFHRGTRQKRRAILPGFSSRDEAMRPLFLCLYPHGLVPDERSDELWSAVQNLVSIISQSQRQPYVDSAPSASDWSDTPRCGGCSGELLGLVSDG
ncbi:hypothetical protein CRENBAI_009448 [Crenichthys baileyi]|uniref:Uncharacterized protein n=1 Tax=Crenichthys baileyi TaxID=28760 RepID=A0AAV9S840_9TELE